MNFGDRRDSHFSLLRNNKHQNPNLQKAWNDYGEHSFKFVILYECKNNESNELLNNLEIEYIEKYKNLQLAYNIHKGGDRGALGTHMLEETKRKIGDKNRINMMGKKASQITKDKMSDSQRKRYAKWTDEDRTKHGCMSSQCASGYKWNDESKQRFSKIQQRKPNGAKYNVDTVIKIRELYEKEKLSITQISEIMNMHRKTVYLIATYRRWKNI